MENKPDNNEVPNKDNIKQEGATASSSDSGPMRIEPSTEILSRLKGNQLSSAAAKPAQQPQKAGGAPGGIYTPAQAGVQAAGKMPRLFKILMIFSGIFLTAGIGVGVVALLDAPVPGFMKPAVDFIGKFFTR
ncbi:MAG: hypothetical protein KAX15_00370 [Candidatus Omnitrophica bacterium]|nr:hypothetical protein [Candidatus Omnitrophota bacterium]